MFGANDGGDTTGYGGLFAPVVLPPAAVRPYGGWFDEVADALRDGRARLRRRCREGRRRPRRAELRRRREHLLEFVQHLRDDPRLRFEMCMGVSGVHWPQDTGHELHAVYPFLSITHNRRVRVEVTCPDDDRHIPSIYSVYPANDWHERETYDFFGIVFDGHPSLTRIEMPDDWPGSPAAQGLPAGWHPRGVQGCGDPAAGRAEALLLMTTTEQHPYDDPDVSAPSRETTEGRIYTVTGGDWDALRQRQPSPARARLWSTWGRSTRRRTACSA